MAWALERDAAQLGAVLDLDPDLRPALVSVSFGGVDPFVARLREAGVRVAVQAGTVAEAERAAAAGADLVVARGGEAGGHGRDAVATLPLLQAVLDRVDVPVVAAGGVAGPRGLAAVLAAGAVGAWVGTAFLTAREAATPPAARQRLLAADGRRHGVRPGLRRRAAARLALRVRRPRAAQPVLRPLARPSR